MPGIGNISAVTEFGQFCYGTKENFYNTDLSLILFPSELKVNYQTLHKVVHTLAMDGLVFAGSPAMIGGMPGPAEVLCFPASPALYCNTQFCSVQLVVERSMIFAIFPT